MRDPGDTSHALPAVPAHLGMKRYTAGWRRLLPPLATGFGYYLGAAAGVALSTMSEGIAIFWLPNGVLLAALLVAPRRDWPLYLAAAVAAEIVADFSTFTLLQSLGFAATNLFECLLAATLLNRVARPFVLDRLRHVVLFGLYGPLLACGLAALLGAIIYTSMLSMPTRTSFWAFWMIWWLGDGLGVLLVTPLLLAWLRRLPAPLRKRRWEALALATLTVLSAAWVFSQPANNTASVPSSPFLLLPLSLWAAARFDVRGAASFGLLIAAIALAANAAGTGPLTAATPGATVLLLQQYLAALVFSTIALAALLRELRERNLRLRIRERAIEAIDDAVVILDAREQRAPAIFANAASRALTGGPSGEALARRCCGSDLEAQRADPLVSRLCASLHAGRPARALLHDVGPDGADSWNELLVAPVPDEQGGVTHYVAIQRDMTEIKRNEAELLATHVALDRLNSELEARVRARTEELQRANEQLEQLASIDPLTGASNRRSFLERARADVSRAQRQGLALSVIMLDIDFFKAINDRFGHEAGDKVLVALAATIRSTLRAGDVFARLGGEEFVVMLPGQSLADAHRMAERLRQLIGQMVLTECPTPITVSAGVAALSAQDEAIDDLLRRADRALYLAKNQGRNRVCEWNSTQEMPISPD